jgi:hypothetical protein
MIIIEIQHSNDGTNATLVNSYTDQAIAEQKYHQVLAAAAVSNVDVHSAVMMDDTGNRIKGETYYHGTLK